MKKIKILLSMCAFLWTGMVFAVGSGAGNGGDAVVCYSDSTRQVIQSVQMFDYWEQEQVVHLPDGIQLGAVNASLQEKIDISINRLGYFNTTLADQIRPVAMSIANNINSFLVTSYQLPDINDANPRAIPSAPNCFIEQFAVQWKEPTTGQRKFAIAAKFFNFTGTSNDTKVGIILHEAYYRYALQNGVNDSDGTRYLNYVLATNYLNDHDLVKYSDLLNDSKYNFNKCTLQTLPFLNQRTLVSNLDQLKWQKLVE